MTSTTAAHRWALLGLLGAATFIAYVDRVNLSVAIVAPSFIEAFALDSTQRGLVISAFFWAYALGQLPAGAIVDRFGTKYPLAIGFFVWSLASAATSLAGSLNHLLALRFLLGISEAILIPASMRWIRVHIPDGERGVATGFFTAGSYMGAMGGVLVTTLLLVQLGWKGMFIALGLGSLVWLLPWLTLARQDRPSPGTIQAPAPVAAIPMRQIMRLPAVWATAIGTFCKSYFGTFCMTWLPSYFVERHGMSLQAMSVFVSAGFACMAAFGIASGYRADWLIRRGSSAVQVHRAFTIFGLLLCSTQLLGVFVESKTAALVIAVVSMAGLGIASVNCWALTQALISREAIGRVYGVQNFASSLSGITAAFATGWLLDVTGSYTVPMIVVLVVLLVGVGAYATLSGERYRAAAEAG